MKKIYILIVFALVLCTGAVQAQRRIDQNTNTWFMYFGSHKFSKKWGLHAEGHIRRSDVVAEAQQHLLRFGLNYHFQENAFVTAGYCYVDTWAYGTQPAASRFPENRWWEQVQVRSQVGRLEWVNRLRLEQRYVKVPVRQPDNSFAPGDAVYTNRMRWLNRVSIPFKGQKIEEKSFYLSLYDEVMVNFGKKVRFNTFDQNRAYAAIGYRLPKWGRLELGYMHQLIAKGDGILLEENHTLMLSLSSSVPLRK
jgi:hypothetical protein